MRTPPSPRRPEREHLLPFADSLKRLPFWLLGIILLGVLTLWSIVSRSDYRVIFRATAGGLLTTLWVSLVAFGFAIALGLLLGLCRVSPFRPIREVATFIVEIVRGVPMLVILYYIAFIGAPGLVQAVNFLLGPLTRAGILPPITVRSISFSWRAIIALTLGYGAFLSEIFRAGIESIPAGQWEAAYALGLRRGQAMSRIVLPQAIRNVLPPLGNEFVAMIKDSALVSALGVQDVTQMGKVYAAGTFKFFETYNIVAFLYLFLTITLSMLVRLLERRLKTGRTATHLR
ncbi:MAG TPA: amino acid ABC transporter permease [Spirochaetia bacterium]|nr:amino acid ABC transporter permease [Spirochaetia bacterium]